MNAEEAKERSMNNSKAKDIISSINERIEWASSDGEFKVFYSIPIFKELTNDEVRVVVEHFKEKGFNVLLKEDKFIGDELVVRWG